LYAPVFAEDSRAKEVLAADDARIAAMVSADSGLLGPLLSDDLQYSHSTGAVDTKKTLLSLIEKKEIRYVAYQPTERSVAFSGSDIAFVNGRAEIGVKHKDQSFEKMFVFLSVWRLERDAWRLLRWQSSQLMSVMPAVGHIHVSGDTKQKNSWQLLVEGDFKDVNGEPDTWSWRAGVLSCTGRPVGVTRFHKPLENFELSLQWRHLSVGGNSGVFLWAPSESLLDLPPGKLPRGGIEVQILDHGYTEQYKKKSGRKATWFTTDGDVFAVGTSKMNPFPPLSPNGTRSFPNARYSRGSPQWNHYYVRAVNKEVRLWVNGHEVSGGNQCSPSTGYLCLESEGAPIEFKEIYLRELP
jgi:hypothetical protein